MSRFSVIIRKIVTHCPSFISFYRRHLVDTLWLLDYHLVSGLATLFRTVPLWTFPRTLPLVGVVSKGCVVNRVLTRTVGSVRLVLNFSFSSRNRKSTPFWRFWVEEVSHVFRVGHESLLLWFSSLRDLCRVDFSLVVHCLVGSSRWYLSLGGSSFLDERWKLLTRTDINHLCRRSIIEVPGGRKSNSSVRRLRRGRVLTRSETIGSSLRKTPRVLCSGSGL